MSLNYPKAAARWILFGLQAMRLMKIKKPHPKSGASTSIAAAKSAEADTDESRWEARLKAVVKPPAKLAKKPKK